MSLFVRQREMPSFLIHSYSLTGQSTSKGISSIINRGSHLLQETSETTKQKDLKENFKKNISKLEQCFANISEQTSTNEKPLCAYFVSSAKDSNGAILSKTAMYLHLFHIKKLLKHYAVEPKVIRSSKELFAHLKNLKAQYPDREIQVVSINCHGSKTHLEIDNPKSKTGTYNKSSVKRDQFLDCSSTAVIILKACETGRGGNSIAEKIAKKNPNKTVLAPEGNLIYTKYIISAKEGHPKIKSVMYTHGKHKASKLTKFGPYES